MADREPDSFRTLFTDLEDVRIEALTFWQHTFADRCAARLVFVDPERGEITVDLPKPDDVRIAIKQLIGVLGDQISVNATWDWGKGRYVAHAS
jgi:hypothetical protein